MFVLNSMTWNVGIVVVGWMIVRIYGLNGHYGHYGYRIELGGSMPQAHYRSLWGLIDY
jgi:hypothetical protein